MTEAPKILTPEYYERLQAIERKHPWTRAMRRLSFDLLKRQAGGDRGLKLLDAGCGTGLFLTECSKEIPGAQPTGIDVSVHGLRAAQSLGVQRLAVADSAGLPFREAEFDAIACHDVLQHLAESHLERTLREFARILRPNGALVVRTAARRGLPGKRHRDSEDYRQWEPATLAAALKGQGFEVEFLTRVNWLPSLLADLKAAGRPRPKGDVGLNLNPNDGAGWKGSVLQNYWALERRMVLATGWSPGGHTLIALARKRG